MTPLHPQQPLKHYSTTVSPPLQLSHGSNGSTSSNQDTHSGPPFHLPNLRYVLLLNQIPKIPQAHRHPAHPLIPQHHKPRNCQTCPSILRFQLPVRICRKPLPHRRPSLYRFLRVSYLPPWCHHWCPIKCTSPFPLTPCSENRSYKTNHHNNINR